MSRVKALRTEKELKAAFPVLKELRPYLTFAAFLRLYRQARAADGYTLVGVFSGGRCAAVMGYRVLSDFVHGKHVYIDDLVTTEACRGQGIGAKLLAYAQANAKSLGCRKLRLCTGNENAAGRRFYEREGWEQRAVVYKKSLGHR